MIWLAIGLALARSLDGLPVDSNRDLPVESPSEPIVPVATALARAAAAGTGRPRARLAWQEEEGRLRRVWTVELRRSVGVTSVRVDAVTGIVLSVDDGAVPLDPPLARAYRHNPTLDGSPFEVDLPLATLGLSDDRVELLQCRDLGEIEHLELDSGAWDLHVCTAEAADGPNGGDYLYDPVPFPLEPGRDEDPFAAPQVYWNVHTALDWFDALGWEPVADFVDPRLIVTVNQRDTDLWSLATASDPTAALAPYDNAYSTGGYLDFEETWVPPELVFGQGSVVDYGYDADVIHHELGHFIVKSVAGPSRSGPGVYGPSTRASALNEGFADYFSSAIHGDPYLAEYAGDGEAIRDLSGDADCFADLTGEPHYDSLPFSQPLWLLRAGLAPADQTALDRAVLDSLTLVGPNADLPDAAAILEDLVLERLGAGLADALRADWEARGVHTCLPVVDVEPGTTFRRFSQVPASYPFATKGEVPGYLQFRVEVPDGGAHLELTLVQLEYLGLDPFKTNVPEALDVIGRSTDPIHWERVEATQETTVAGQPTTLDVLDWVSDGETVATVVETGNQAWWYDPQYAEHTYGAGWDVATPGPFHFQLANRAARSVTAYSLTLTTAPRPRAAEPIIATGIGGLYRGGCGCSSGAGDRWGWGGLLSLVAFRRGRRPRR